MKPCNSRRLGPLGYILNCSKEGVHLDYLKEEVEGICVSVTYIHMVRQVASSKWRDFFFLR